MGEGTVVKEALTDDMIRNGAALVAWLDARGFPVSSAFWLYEEETNRWTLMIASPRSDDGEPMEAIRAVRQAIDAMPQAGRPLTLFDTTVVGPRYLPVALLRKVFDTGPVISSIRYTFNMIDGVIIDDALIYRSTDLPSANQALPR